MLRSRDLNSGAESRVRRQPGVGPELSGHTDRAGDRERTRDPCGSPGPFGNSWGQEATVVAARNFSTNAFWLLRIFSAYAK